MISRKAFVLKNVEMALLILVLSAGCNQEYQLSEGSQVFYIFAVPTFGSLCQVAELWKIRCWLNWMPSTSYVIFYTNSGPRRQNSVHERCALNTNLDKQACQLPIKLLGPAKNRKRKMKEII